jgi:PAS domain S-box-containing protein
VLCGAPHSTQFLYIVFIQHFLSLYKKAAALLYTGNKAVEEIMSSQIRTKYGHWFQSIFARLTLISLGAVVLLGLVSSVYLWFEVKNSTLDSLVSQGNNLVDELSITGSELLAHHDITAVQQVIDRVFDSNNLKDILVVNDSGLILAEKILPTAGNPTVIGYQTIFEQNASLKQTLASGKPATSWNAETFTTIQPIFDSDLLSNGKQKVIGAVIVQIRLQSVEARRISFLSQNGMFSAFILLAMVGIITPIIYIAVIRPLNRVTYATQLISSGALYARLPVAGAQEFKTLATSFNQMAAELQANKAEMRQRLDEVSVLYKISTLISQTIIMEEQFNCLATFLTDLVNGTGAYIILWDKKRQAPVLGATYGSFNSKNRNIEIYPDEPNLVAKVLELGQPIVIEDTLNSANISARVAAQFPEKSLLGLPLIANQQKIGVILIGETRRQRTFTEHEVQLAMSAAGQIASAMANAELFKDLATERNRLNDIVNAVSDPIIVSDLNGRIQSANRAFSIVTGWSLASVLGKLGRDLFLVPKEQIEPTWAEIRATTYQGNIWQRELTGLRPDGSNYDAELNISSIRDSGGEIVGQVASLRDITNFKELDRMKNRFVSTVSHELRTPLSVINLCSENLLEFYDRLDDRQRQGLISDIHSETNTLHQLIEDLLSLSRLDSGKAEPRRVDFDLVELLGEAVNSTKILAGEKDIHFEYSLPVHRVPVVADRDQLRQVLHNLLENAIKFTPGTGKVSLDYELVGEHIVLRISDTGIGIPEADLPHIYERFYRSELSTQQEIPGTGLGLAITKEILDRHLGAISVESEIGKGSTFRVMLPLSDMNEASIQ